MMSGGMGKSTNRLSVETCLLYQKQKAKRRNNDGKQEKRVWVGFV
jgi:hypothetical protein